MKTKYYLPYWTPLRTKSIFRFRVVCYFRLKRQKACGLTELNVNTKMA